MPARNTHLSPSGTGWVRVIPRKRRVRRLGPGDGALAGRGGPERPALKRATVIPGWAARWIPLSRLKCPGSGEESAIGGRTCQPHPNPPPGWPGPPAQPRQPLTRAGEVAVSGR